MLACRAFRRGKSVGNCSKAFSKRIRKHRSKFSHEESCPKIDAIELASCSGRKAVSDRYVTAALFLVLYVCAASSLNLRIARAKQRPLQNRKPLCIPDVRARERSFCSSGSHIERCTSGSTQHCGRHGASEEMQNRDRHMAADIVRRWLSPAPRLQHYITQVQQKPGPGVIIIKMFVRVCSSFFSKHGFKDGWFLSLKHQLSPKWPRGPRAR